MNLIKIGITGHRFLEQDANIYAGIQKVLLRIMQTYPDRSWSVLSSLAEGADRLVVEQVLQFKPGTNLVVPLPMDEENYIKDFKEKKSKLEFLRLLHLATEVVPPQRESMGKNAYWSAGKYILDNCDILIALWDGLNAQGHGGTGELVDLAIGKNIPLAWVHCTNHNVKNPLNRTTSSNQGEVSFLNFPEKA
jgi:hypothetical protein